VVGDAWDHPSTGHGKGVVAPGKGTRQCPGPFRALAFHRAPEFMEDYPGPARPHIASLTASG